MTKKLFHASHLELKHQTYYAVLYVPKDVRVHLNQTGDIRIAQNRANALVVTWNLLIRQARNRSHDPFIEEALDLNNYRRTSSSPSDVIDVINQKAEELSKTQDPIIGAEFKAIATGQKKLLKHFMAGWEQRLADKKLKRKTIERMVKDVTELVEFFPTCQLLDSKHIDIWLESLESENSLKASSVNRIFGSCRSFYAYLKECKEIPESEPHPFKVPSRYVISKRKNAKSGFKTEPWLAFQPDEVVQLYWLALHGGDEVLSDLIYIAAYTGARIEELCSLKCIQVDFRNKCFQIEDSKTEAGVRKVPIHSAILQKVRNMVADSDDEFLIHGLSFNKYGSRSNAIGKRFGRLKAKHNYSSRHVFHSIRKTFTTQLENAGVLENVAADIVGHDKPRITYGLYSGGATLKVKQLAIEKVRYDFAKPPKPKR